MGTSTDAILFYGYCWDDEAEHPPWSGDSDEEWEERYAARHGCPKPTTLYPDRWGPDGKLPTDYTAAEQAIIKQHETYWEQQRAIVEASPCEINTHCSGECPMPFVMITASCVLARRGYPQEISALTVDPAWNAKIHAFCRELDINIKGKRLGWWLVSDWN